MKTCTQIRISLIALLLAANGSASGAVRYLVQDLGALTGPVSSAVNLDSSGRVAGIAMLANSHFHGVLWDGGPIDLGTIGSDGQSRACAVNDAGQVVGVSYDYGDIQSNAFMWHEGAMNLLGVFSPRDLNEAGLVVGHRTVFNSANLWVDRACKWNSGTLSDLGTLGGSGSDAFAVNASGVIAGQSFLSNDLTLRGCVWINGVINDLGTILGSAGAQSSAADLNDQNQVVGWSDASGGQPHACLFQLSADGQVTQRTDLGVLGGGYSYAHGINNGGAIVGSSDSRGFIFQSGIMTDLNSVIPQDGEWLIVRAAAINDGGLIVGEGVRLGFPRAVLLVPVPCLKADMNEDGRVDGRDAQMFADVLIAGGTETQICAGDVEPVADGAVTMADVNPFVHCLLSGACP